MKPNKKALIYIGFQRMPSKTKAEGDFRQRGKENYQEIAVDHNAEFGRSCGELAVEINTQKR